MQLMTETMHDRLKSARAKAGFQSAEAAAKAFDWPISTYRGHENSSRGITFAKLDEYARAFRTEPSWLAYGISKSDTRMGGVSTDVLKEVIMLVLEADGAKEATNEELASLVIDICDYIQKSGHTGISNVIEFQLHRLQRQRA
jgi:hypothetical protein